MQHKFKIILGAVLSVFILLSTTAFANVVVNDFSSKSEIINFDIKYEKIIDDKKNIEFLLFKTAIDISNDNEIINIIDKNEIISKIQNCNYKDMFLKILVKNPLLLFSILRVKPTISDKYFGYINDIGIELSEILDKNDIYSITESISSNYNIIHDDFTNIIINKDELRKNINELNTINNKYESNDAFIDYPIICSTLLFMIIPTLMLLTFYSNFIFDAPITLILVTISSVFNLIYHYLCG
jgi:hypothetical protein